MKRPDLIIIDDLVNPPDTPEYRAKVIAWYEKLKGIKMPTELAVKLSLAMEKFTKWRAVFAGWQLGTRDANDPECKAVKNHRELSMCLRVEVNALTKLMLDKGVFTGEEFQQQLLDEVQHMDKQYELQFPGISTDLTGIRYKMPEVAETMKNWRP